MANATYWHRRLTEVTLKASATGNQRLRSVYLDLAAHYLSMARLCSAEGKSQRDTMPVRRFAVTNDLPAVH